MGTMGRGIAQVAAMSGCEVLVFDAQSSMLERSKEELVANLKSLTEKGKISQAESEAVQNRYHWCHQLNQLFQSDWIIEAIREDLDLKKQIFLELSGIVSDQCILATNTSSLSVTSLASSVTLPERFIGIHFFNPAQIMPLVEVVPAIQTDPTVLEKSLTLIRDFGKLPISVKDTPGFIVNRIARPYYGEALRILEEGIADIATIDWAMTRFGGFKMGPFKLMDFIGHDVNYQVTETIFKAFYYDPRYRPSFTQRNLVEAGYLGRKSGRGFYDYREGAEVKPPLEDETLGKSIFERIIAMLINEAAEALFLGISSRDDIETAMTRGVNYPKGLLAWADEIGIAQCVTRMDRLYERYREDRYRCSPLLRTMADEQQKFF